ncbi:zinc-dependent metalloprotease [Roseateles sp. BYS87W]|uniref:Zinc-dependent metalloprotease n=1 Tax=Pelomonas baiyunensis TaxID=3299026 RepID=A0ABW7GSU4_9BURK
MTHLLQGWAERARTRTVAAALTMATALAAAQTSPTPPSPPASAASAAAPARAASAPVVPDPSDPKPYDKVITAEAKTQSGLLRVHQLKSKLYFEIPKAVLDQPLLMVANATAVPSGLEHVGRTLNQDVLRFVLKQNRVMLQLISHDAVTAPGSPMAEAVRLSQRDAILAVFPVEAFAKDGAPVIEVTRLFNSEVGDFSARAMVRGGLDSSRSYVEQTKAFPGSVRVDAVQTYTVSPMPVMAVPGVPALPQMQPARSVSLNVAYSLVQLPAEPMRPRLMDDRVGFFSIGRTDFGSGVREVRRERLITRWRLEKKDPAVAVSEPVKPIVWYIDKATPTALVPYVKRGVEAWNAAFEHAGFKNAVQARPFPTAEEDPEFDPEDVRYSVIRWVPSPTPNAYGPHLADPRSGEILNANIVMFHNIVQLQRDWYLTQVGPLDPRARKLPLPDDLMGELVAFVVTHEVGHSLGFPHNMKASSLYPVDKLRDPTWLRTMGHVPTLMDYSRFNYLVQPEDKVDPALLIPKLGPYDFFATHWGYAPIPSANTPEEERQQLNLWAREQDSKPWLRFSAPKAEGGDVGDNTEAVGDADAVTATALGQRNLQRVMKMLPGWTGAAGDDDKTLEYLYRATWAQWLRELGHVVAVVGSYEVQNKHNDQPGAIAAPLPRAQQARAVKFLAEHALATPQWLLDPAVTQRLRTSEPTRLLASAQRTVLRQLLDPVRGQRLVAQQAQLGGQAYRVDDLLADLRHAVIGPDAAAPVPAPVPSARRSLQRLYVDTLIARLSLASLSSLEDGQAQVRAELRALKLLAAARAGQGDASQRAHWHDLADSIERALDPRAPTAANPLAALLRMFNAPQGAQPPAESRHACWAAHAHDGLGTAAGTVDGFDSPWVR